MKNSYLGTVVKKLMQEAQFDSDIEDKQKSLKDAAKKAYNDWERTKATAKVKVTRWNDFEKLMDKLHARAPEIYEELALELNTEESPNEPIPSWENWRKEKLNIAAKNAKEAEEASIAEKQKKKEEASLNPSIATEIKSTNLQWINWSEAAKELYSKADAEQACKAAVKAATTQEEKRKLAYKPSGPGEYSVIKEFGNSQVMGPNFNFDITQEINGEITKWEVKEVKGGRIRTSISGIMASASPRFKLNNALDKIKQTSNNMSGDLEVLAILSKKGYQNYINVSNFAKEKLEKIFAAAEMTQEDIETLYFIFKQAKNLKDDLITQAENATSKTSPNEKFSSKNTVIIGGKPVEVSLLQFQKILKALGKENDFEVGEGKNTTARNALKYAEMLDEPAINSPGDFFDSMKQELTPEKSFGDVDGVILVTNSQYCVVENEEIQNILEFEGTTQGGRTLYSVKGTKSKK
jgi:hypothetical protein